MKLDVGQVIEQLAQINVNEFSTKISFSQCFTVQWPCLCVCVFLRWESRVKVEKFQRKKIERWIKCNLWFSTRFSPNFRIYLLWMVFSVCVFLFLLLLLLGEGNKLSVIVVDGIIKYFNQFIWIIFWVMCQWTQTKRVINNNIISLLSEWITLIPVTWVEESGQKLKRKAMWFIQSQHFRNDCHRANRIRMCFHARKKN